MSFWRNLFKDVPEFSPSRRYHSGGIVKASGIGAAEVPPILSQEVRPLPLTWDQYFMRFAHLAARKSKDSTQVGAVLVGPVGEVRLTSFNGPPRGVEDRPERFQRPIKYQFACHAEANLIAFAAREGICTKGCRVYSTHEPCSPCARIIIQAGIAKVVYDNGAYRNMESEVAVSRTMFREAGVAYERIAS